MKTAKIIGTGSYLPKRVVKNDELLRLMDGSDWDIEKARASIDRSQNKGSDDNSSGNNSKDDKNSNDKIYDAAKLTDAEVFDAWVKQVTGIEQRNYYDGDFDDSETFIGDPENMGAEAAKRAIDNAGIKPKDIDYIVACTFTPSMDIPNAACSIGHILGIENVGGAELNTACSGFIDGMIDGYCRITSGYNNVLVVAVDTLSKRINFKDSLTAPLFGDGAGAAVLRADDDTEGGVMGIYTGSNFSIEHISTRYGGLIEMGGGKNVMKKAVEAMSSAVTEAIIDATRRGYDINADDIKYIIPHQANKRIIQLLRKKLGVSERVMCDNISMVGNTSSSTVGIALDRLLRGELNNGTVKRGDNIVLTSVGGGYTIAGLVMKY